MHRLGPHPKPNDVHRPSVGSLIDTHREVLSPTFDRTGSDREILRTEIDDAPPSVEPNEPVRAVLGWDQLEIDTEAAIQWQRIEGWSPADAQPWCQAGFTPQQAEFCDGMIFRAEINARPGEVPSTVEEWLASGIEPLWVCLALSERFTTTDEARALWGYGIEPPPVRGTVGLLRDLLAAATH